MTTILTVFTSMLIAAFAVYASVYSSGMHRIHALERKLKVPGIHTAKIQKGLAAQKERSNSLKKYGLIPFVVIFAFELLFIHDQSVVSAKDYFIASAIFGAFLLCVLLVNWMKGAGTIDNSPRKHKSPWM